jgi:hypothetical protein
LTDYDGGTYVRGVARISALSDARLDSLYQAEGFGGDTTLRARVFRELIDEIRALRRELGPNQPETGPTSDAAE